LKTGLLSKRLSKSPSNSLPPISYKEHECLLEALFFLTKDD